MSTVVSQVTLTCGGSRIEGALGSMLAETLPFLRSIATAIQKELGPGHPGVLPTTMVAYASTSVLLGAVFFALAALRCGRLTGYFPRTVMTGVVGGVGVSLFLLGLEITLPSSTPHLSISTLFENDHLPLLAASLGPAVLLSLSTHLTCLERLATKPTKHPLYIPLFCCAVAGIFWLIVAACEDTSIQGLASAGWLFTSEQGPTQATAAADWDYWALFNFHMVEWRALSAGIGDVLMLVLIGALSLPIFASEAALDWGKGDHSMNHEFVGHGISNTVAGAVGALPNLFVYSNSKFFHNADGRRPEAFLVALFTLVFFFISSRVLPYVPTIQASALVLFIGTELTLQALWESTASLTCCEWIDVAGTTIACASLGFAPGRLKATKPCHHIPPRKVSYILPLFSQTYVADSLSKEMDCPAAEELRSSTSSARQNPPLLPPVVQFRGDIDSFVAPPLEQSFARCGQPSCIILDLQEVCSVGTDLAQCIQREAERIAARIKIVLPRSRLAVMDLDRGGVNYSWDVATSPVGGTSDPVDGAPGTGDKDPDSVEKKKLQAYGGLEDAIRDARYRDGSRSSHSASKQDSGVSLQQTGGELQFILRNLPSPGLVVRKLKYGDIIACSDYPFQPSFVILEGLVDVRELCDAPVDGAGRMCVRKAILLAVKAIFRRKTKTAGDSEKIVSESPCEGRHKVVAPHYPFCARVQSESCLILDIDPALIPRWNEIVEEASQSSASKETE
ncbi:hypothetical protein AA0116_g12652 [Alternaria tenuissima]|uniref:SLC26A/SulP transporter domain-containing protein n=2 Tax=Alternaria tenuissima TaxID=119927 RepID=A0AB37W008_9PLEO|nr:hypothetical protein AA0115_g12635 [Alternaria tenuissima]RYO48208.1 hypothetical protein AA0116_g12652 [Alternaria tenuissima]